MKLKGNFVKIWVNYLKIESFWSFWVQNWKKFTVKKSIFWVQFSTSENILAIPGNQNKAGANNNCKYTYNSNLTSCTFTKSRKNPLKISPQPTISNFSLWTQNHSILLKISGKKSKVLQKNMGKYEKY